MNNRDSLFPDVQTSQEFTSDRNKLNLWLVLIFTATLVPLFSISILSQMDIDAASVVTIGNFIELVGGPGHVGLTSFFYSDPQMQLFF